MSAPKPHPISYYVATANEPIDGSTAARPALTGAVDCDVCVIGGGFTGLWTALYLAERGYDVVVLEANRIGWGASGRNGGQLLTGLATDIQSTEETLGHGDARRLWDMSLDAISRIRQRIAKHTISCDLANGYFHAAVREQHLAHMRDEVERLCDTYQYNKIRIVEENDVHSIVASDRYVGGFVDEGGGHLHPLNLVLGIARAAEAAGARIFEGSDVLGLNDSATPEATVANGRVRARSVVLCVNAYLGRLVPQLRPFVMPVGTYITATEPLGARQAATLLPQGHCVSDSNLVLDYFRVSADHRLLFGGRVSYTSVTPPRLPWIMRRRMLRTFPQLAGVRPAYTWGGFVAISNGRFPHVGRLSPNTYFAHGFSGHGLAMTEAAAHAIAGHIAGNGDTFAVLERIPNQRFPGGRLLRMPLLTLAMIYTRARDFI